MSMFGSSSTNANNPLFGGKPASSIFGNNPSQTGASPNPLANAQNPQQSTTQLFGNPGSGSQQTNPTSLFGSTNNTNQQTGGTSFGNMSNMNPFGSTNQQPQQLQQLQLQQHQQHQQQQQQQQQQQASLFGSTAQPVQSTKFNDLPDNVKQVLEQINTHIQGRIQISKDLHQRKLGEEPTKGQETIKQMQKDMLNTTNVIQNDLRHTEDLKAKVDQAMQDVIVATRIIEAFRNPQSGSSYLKDHAGFPLEFFQRVTQQMVERLTWYKSTIEQIERRLSSSANQVQTPQSIAATLQAQNATFLALASKTAALEAELQKVKALYTQLWRAKTGSVRDPFNDGDRMAENPGDLGFGGLSV